MLSSQTRLDDVDIVVVQDSPTRMECIRPVQVFVDTGAWSADASSGKTGETNA